MMRVIGVANSRNDFIEIFPLLISAIRLDSLFMENCVGVSMFLLVSTFLHYHPFVLSLKMNALAFILLAAVVLADGM